MANCTDQAAPWPAKGFVLVLSCRACPAVSLSVLLSVCPSVCLVSVWVACSLTRWLVGPSPLSAALSRGLFAAGQKENGVALIYFKWLMVLTCLAAFKAYDLWILDSKPADGSPLAVSK